MRTCFSRTHPFQVEARNSNPERGRTGSNRHSTGEKLAPDNAGYQTRIMTQAQQTPRHPKTMRSAHSTKKDEKQQTPRRMKRNPISQNQASPAHAPVHAHPKPAQGEPNHATPAKTEYEFPQPGYCTPHSHHDPPHNRTLGTNTRDPTTSAYPNHGNDDRTHDTTESTGKTCSREQGTFHAPSTYDATCSRTSPSRYRTWISPAYTRHGPYYGVRFASCSNARYTQNHTRPQSG